MHYRHINMLVYNARVVRAQSVRRRCNSFDTLPARTRAGHLHPPATGCHLLFRTGSHSYHRSHLPIRSYFYHVQYRKSFIHTSNARGFSTKFVLKKNMLTLGFRKPKITNVPCRILLIT